MSILYDRIKELCKKNDISIAELEKRLGFGFASINKWSKSTTPAASKVLKIANYFNVSVDYLLGNTDIENTVDDFCKDDTIISLQRARQIMPPTDREKMMEMLKVAFDYAFKE